MGEDELIVGAVTEVIRTSNQSPIIVKTIERSYLFKFGEIPITSNTVTIITLVLAIFTLLMTMYNRFRDIRYKKFDYTRNILNGIVHDFFPAIDNYARNYDAKIATFKEKNSAASENDIYRFNGQCGLGDAFNLLEAYAYYINKWNVAFRKQLQHMCGATIINFVTEYTDFILMAQKDNPENFKELLKLIKKWGGHIDGAK